MTAITVSDVTMHWPLTLPLSLEPTSHGVNNRSFLVATNEASFILKEYRNTGITGRIRFEHALLDALARADLPFDTPEPLPSKSGDTNVEITRDGTSFHLALFPRIPGQAAVVGLPAEACRCGQALAILDSALASVTPNIGMSPPEAFGDLSSIHALIPQPIPSIQQAFGTDLARMISAAESRFQRNTSGWSSQLIHGDFYPSNTLMDSGEVSGVLDFEFSGVGYRAMDFAIGLGSFSTRNVDIGCSWPLLESFATGYLRRSPLPEVALVATPTLLLMREATSLIHWLGRMKQGLTTPGDMHDRALRLRSLHDWLEAHQAELVDRILRLNRLGEAVDSK